ATDSAASRFVELAIDIRGDDEAAAPSGGGVCAPGAQDCMTCVRLCLAIALEAMPVERPCHARLGGEPQGLRHALEGDALGGPLWSTGASRVWEDFSSRQSQRVRLGGEASWLYGSQSLT